MYNVSIYTAAPETSHPSVLEQGVRNSKQREKQPMGEESNNQSKWSKAIQKASEHDSGNCTGQRPVQEQTTGSWFMMVK